MTEELAKLVEAARQRPFPEEEREAQRRSFAYGNAKIENDRVTMEMIIEADEQIKLNSQRQNNGDETRHSRALDAQIITDPDELARKESFNVIEQYRAVTEMVESFLAPDRPFKLRPSHLLHLHRVALDGISAYAGNWRPAGIEIGESKHKPPGAFQVPEQIEELCDYVNDKWTEKSPLHLAAYVMWKLNWIHPFTDGNGRTSRAVSYMVLCIRLGTLLPGKLTIPEQVERDKRPYYKALEAADDAWAEGRIDLMAMKQLLSSMLARQLVAVHEDSELAGIVGGVALQMTGHEGIVVPGTLYPTHPQRTRMNGAPGMGMWWGYGWVTCGPARPRRSQLRSSLNVRPLPEFAPQDRKG